MRYVQNLLVVWFVFHAPVLVASAQATGTPATPAAATEVLFNGQNLDGWNGDPRLWSVRDGVIHGETTAESAAKGNTFLISSAPPVGDFELRLAFRCNATNNSGIQYRSRHINDGSASNAWVVRGYQHEVRNETEFPNVSGFIYDEGGSRGRLCLIGERAEWTKDGKVVHETGLMDAPGFHSLFRLDAWNEVKIVAEGPRVRHYLNNHLVLDFTDHHPELALRAGIIALQLHAGAPMWAEFKDIQLIRRDAAK